MYLEEGGDGLNGIKTTSRGSSSVDNSGGTTREHHSSRRKSDSMLDLTDKYYAQIDQMIASDDVQELRRSIVVNQEHIKQMQMQINVKDKQISVLKNRAAAFDAYMQQEGQSKTQLEGEVKRLNLRIEEMKRLGGKSMNEVTPTDPEMIKDPAFHLEFVLQHASELVMENEKLRASLAEYQQKEAGVSLNPPAIDQPPTPTISSNSLSGQGISRHRKKNSLPTIQMA
eukprot:TRINITY_DN5439_c0_g1_i1.p1 TRINITY_DN5439_c0_g1~~TRINITY_DN5439_c0_g1_i1.p1  ORF type:complete len:242 (-),score=37.65 TRINITY_DN5439_c0_g1_i1:99-779(-)